MDFFNTIAEFVPETITLMFWLLFLSSSGLIFYWLKNRNKYLNHSHEVPESLVRDYQASIDKNMEAQKSNVLTDSKFASVMKAEDLSNNSQNISIINDQIKLLMAEILSLKDSLKSRDEIIDQLEQRVPSSKSVDTASEFDLEELKRLKTDNDDLRAKLKEFELMEDDLVLLRDLKIENKDLRKKLGETNDEEEIQVVKGNNDEDEEILNIAGSKEEEDDDLITVSGKNEADSNDDDMMAVKELKGAVDKKEVQFNDRQKNFGSVKIKDGNIFGSSKPKPQSKPTRDKSTESFGSINAIEDEIAQIGSIINEKMEKEESPETKETSLKSDVEVESPDQPEEEGNVEQLKKKVENTTEVAEEGEKESSIVENDKSAEELLDEFEKMLG